MNQAEIDKWNMKMQKVPSGKAESVYAIDREKLFPRKSRVLDLGGSTGCDALYFAQKGHSVVVADISDKALEVAKDKSIQLNLGITTQQLILPDAFTFESNVFDIVYSRLSVHYFNTTETKKIIGEIYRVLKLKGKAYITVKSPEDLKEFTFLKETAREIEPNLFDDNGDIKSRYTINQWKEIVRTLNFSKVDIHNYIEDFSGRVDFIASGSKSFLLTELILEK